MANLKKVELPPSWCGDHLSVGETSRLRLLTRKKANEKRKLDPGRDTTCVVPPGRTFDDEKKLIFLEIDVDEGKQFYVRRIEFQGNTTTRDEVIRRELAIKEGQIYNGRLWKFSLLRLNQLGYFEPLKPDDPSTTDLKLDEKNGTVDLTLKVKEK